MVKCLVSVLVVLSVGMVIPPLLPWLCSLTALLPMQLWLIMVISGMLTSLVLPNPIFGDIPPWLLQTILRFPVLSLVISPLVFLNVMVLPLAVIMRMVVGVTMDG